jgi:hypothetical protein
VAGLLYLRPLFRTFELAGTFTVLLLISILFGLTFRDRIDFYFAVVYFPCLFYLTLGIKDLVLIHREGWKIFLNFALAYPALLMFFYYNSGNLWWKLPILFAVILFLSKDFLSKRMFYWLTAFLTVQIAWASDLLPIGFVSAANLSMLFYASLISFFDLHIRNALNRRSILTLASSFILLLTAIFLLSRWSF